MGNEVVNIVEQFNHKESFGSNKKRHLTTKRAFLRHKGIGCTFSCGTEDFENDYVTGLQWLLSLSPTMITKGYV